MASNLPPLADLTSNERFRALPLEQKNTVLNDWFGKAEAIDPTARQIRPLTLTITGLEHEAERETPAIRSQLEAERGAYINAFRQAREGLPQEEVLATFNKSLEDARSSQKIERAKRLADLDIATEYAGLELNAGNAVSEALGSAAGFSPILERRAEIENITGLNGEQLNALAQEAQVVNGRGPAPANVDSQGEIHPNVDQLLTNKEGVRQAIVGLKDAPENARKRALQNLDAAEERLLEATANTMANAEIIVPTLDTRGQAEGMRGGRTEILGDRINRRALEIEKGRSDSPGVSEDGVYRMRDISSEAMTQARRDIIGEAVQNEANRNFLTRGLRDLFTDLRGVINLATGDDSERLDADRALAQVGRAIDNPGMLEGFGEGLVRLVPQILLTRGIGTGAGLATGLGARAFGVAEQAATTAATRAATGAAIGFGGLQSASGAVEAARQAGLSDEEQLQAGVMAFLVTSGVAAGFQRLGLGGVESFQNRMLASRKELAGALARGGFGEFAEESTDEIINAFTSGAIANPDADLRDIAAHAFQAGLYGAIFGAGTAATQVRIAPRNAPTASMSDAELKAAADARLVAERLLPTNVSEGEQRRADIAAVDPATETPIPNPDPVLENGSPQIQSDESNLPQSDVPDVRVLEPSGDNGQPTVDPEPTDRQTDGAVETQGTLTDDRSFSDRGLLPPDPTFTPEERAAYTARLQSQLDNQNAPQPAGLVVQEAEPAEVTDAPTENQPPTDTSVPESPGQSADDSGPVAVQTADPPQPGEPIPPQTRELTQNDVARINRLTQAIASDPQVQDVVRNAITDEAIRNPDQSDAFFRRIGQRAASSRRDLSASERRARAEGNVASLQAETEVGTVEDAVAAPPVEAPNTDLATRTREAIGRLNAREQAAINGQLEGRTDAEIAAELGTTPSAVAVARNRALEKLRRDTTLREAEETDYVERESVPSETDQQLVTTLQNSFRALGQRGARIADRLQVSTARSRKIDAARKVGEFLKVRVVVVDNLPSRANGVFNAQTPGTVFISSKTSRPEFMVTIHEALHAFRQSDPTGYDTLLSEVAPDLEAFLQARPDYSPLGRSALAEEFLADFLADRLTDQGFVDSLAERSRIAFESFARLLRGLIKRLLDGRQGTEAFVADLRRADAALADALLKIRLREGPSRTESTGLRFETRNPQIAGDFDPEQVYNVTSFTEASQILERNYFNWKEQPVDADGIRGAESFLVNLTDPEFIQAFQTRLVNTSETIDTYTKAAIAAGVGRDAFWAYTARLSDTNKAEALRLVKLGRALSSEIRTITDGRLNSSDLGLLLRSFGQTTGGGSVGELFEVEFEGRERNLKDTYDEATLKLIRDVDLSVPRTIEDGPTISAQQRETNSTLREGYEGAVLSLDPELARQLQESENRSWRVLERVVTLLDGLARANLSFETPFNRFRELVNTKTNLDEALDIVEQLVTDFEARMNPQQRDAVDAARREGKESVRQRENATGRSKTKNVIDILGKRFVGAVNRFDNANQTKEDDNRKAFQDLLSQELGPSEFTEAYVALGGTAEVASEVYDAVLKRDARRAERATAAETKRQERLAQRAERATEKAETERLNAEGRIQSIISNLGEPGRTAARPTAQNDTFQKAFNRFINLKNASVDSAEFEAQLRQFIDANGNPVLTEDQVQEISVRAVVARKEALAARASQLEAQREQALLRDRQRELRKVESWFVKPQQRDAAKRTLNQIIEGEFINNPNRRIQTQAEQIEFAKEILTELTDLSPADIDKLAPRMVKDLVNKTEEAIFKAVKPFLTKLVSGRVTADALSKAIRLNALDPSKDFLTSVAALNGWDGLTTDESLRLLELERKVNLVDRTSAPGVRILNQQARIIFASSGVSPGTKDLMNSYLMGSMYGALSTQLIGITAIAYQAGSLALRERAYAIFRNGFNIPGAIREMAEYNKASDAGRRAALNAYIVTLRSGVSPIQQLQAGQEVEGGDGSVYVDALTRKYDLETKKLVDMAERIAANPGSIPRAEWKRFQSQFFRYIVTSQRFSLRSLTAIDAFATTWLAETKARMLTYRAAQDNGINSQQYDAITEEAMQNAESHRNFLRDVVKLTDEREINLEVFNRVNGAIVQGLLDVGVNTSNFRKEAISDIRARIGTGETSQRTLIGYTTNTITNFIRKIPVLPLSGLLPAVRTTGNIMDEMLWDAPGIGLARVFKATRLKKSDPVRFKETFPNIIADWQLRERRTRAVVSLATSTGLFFLLRANAEKPDDEKWFWYTGPYPAVDPAERARYNRNLQERGWQANMLIIGSKEFQTRISMGRGAFESLGVPLLIARMLSDATDSSGAELQDLANTTVGLATVLVPGYSQLTSVNNASESGRGITNRVAQETLKFIPFSGAIRTPRRFVPASIDKKASTAFWNVVDPYYADRDADGAVYFKNVLGETVKEETNPLRWIAAAGIPMSFRIENWNTGARDPKKAAIMKDFVEKGYDGGRHDIDAFKAKLEKAKVPYTTGTRSRFESTRAAEFVRLYTAEREKMIRSRNYANAVGGLWSRATRRGYSAVGVKDD